MNAEKKEEPNSQEAQLNRLSLWQLKKMLPLSTHLSIMPKGLAGADGNNPRILSFYPKIWGLAEIIKLYWL